jgi:predicted NodU family carbamoyl transferase
VPVYQSAFEPTARDAVRSFYSSGIDAMFVGHFFLQK